MDSTCIKGDTGVCHREEGEDVRMDVSYMDDDDSIIDDFCSISDCEKQSDNPVTISFPTLDWKHGVAGWHTLTFNEFYHRFMEQTDMYMKQYCADSFGNMSIGDKIMKWNSMAQDCISDIIFLRVPSCQNTNDYILHQDLINTTKAVQELAKGTESEDVLNKIMNGACSDPGLYLICDIVSMTDIYDTEAFGENHFEKMLFTNFPPLERLHFKESMSGNEIRNRGREPHVIQARLFTRFCGLRKGGFVEIDHFTTYMHENKQFAQSDMYDIDVINKLHKWSMVFSDDVYVYNVGAIEKEIEVYTNTVRNRDCTLRLIGGGKCPSRLGKDTDSAIMGVMKLTKDEKNLK